MAENYQNIQKRLAEAIKQSGISQSDLARRLGISPATVSHYIIGDKMPALDTLANLCTIIDADANDILCVGEYKKS